MPLKVFDANGVMMDQLNWAKLGVNPPPTMHQSLAVLKVWLELFDPAQSTIDRLAMLEQLDPKKWYEMAQATVTHRTRGLLSWKFTSTSVPKMTSEAARAQFFDDAKGSHCIFSSSGRLLRSTYVTPPSVVSYSTRVFGGVVCGENFVVYDAGKGVEYTVTKAAFSKSIEELLSVPNHSLARVSCTWLTLRDPPAKRRDPMYDGLLPVWPGQSTTSRPRSRSRSPAPSGATALLPPFPVQPFEEPDVDYLLDALTNDDTDSD